MNHFEKITINSKVEANGFLLFIIWLFIIILPFLVLSECIEVILKDSENRLLTKHKILLLDEVNKFRMNLTSSYYLDSKFSEIPSNNFTKDYNITFLRQSIERHTKSKIAALFYYNSTNDTFESYVSEKFNKDLGMHSRFTMKNLLLTYASKITDKKQKDRSIAYFENLLTCAGGINLKPNNTVPILSGKTELGRMLGYFKTFGNLKEPDNQMFLCLIREKDIPLKEIIRNAIDTKSERYFNREIVSLKDSIIIDSDFDKFRDERFIKFQFNEKDGLSIYSVTSDEMLLRMGTDNTYYPSRINNIINNEPILKVTLPKSALEHPMRDTIKNLKFPAILFIFLITIGLVKIGIFGYAMNIRILGRVLICVIGAVILPFASFIAAVYYNQYFAEEYFENEIEHYTQTQTEVINKAIEAYIGNKELEITKLQSTISNMSADELYNYLNEWIKDSGASVISYNHVNNSKETVIKPPNIEASLSQLAKEAKELFNISFSNAFRDVDLQKAESMADFESIFGKFLPNGIAPVVTNIGTIYASVPNEPDSLYSLFPIYRNEKKDNKMVTKVIGSVLIKYDTYRLLSDLKKRSKFGLFQNIIIGKYVVKNAIIPINEDGLIPDKSKMLLANDFSVDDIGQRINQIFETKSIVNWTTPNSINTGLYINHVNAIVVCRAELIKGTIGSGSEIDLEKIFIYLFIMILTLSISLGSIIVSPIRELQKASNYVAEGNYSYKIESETGDEFESLSEAFNGMTEALLQKEKMSSYVSKDVIEEVSNNNENLLQPSGERIPVSVLFCALSGQKELNQYSPEEVTKIISCLIDAVDEISTAFNGQVDKLIEDTVMVVFRKNNLKENITLNACRAALAINNRLKKELPDFKIKMGIASGDAVSGKIGSRNGKLDYTVIGNPVNLAARLKVQAGKAKNTGILICPYSIRLIQGAGRLNFIERMTIKGRTNRTFPLYELIGLREC